MVLERIRLSDDGASFAFADSRRPFIPYGFNYLGGDAGFLEDRWDDALENIKADFREMKALGANTVRIHLQVGRFLDAPAAPGGAPIPNVAALENLVRLVEMSEEVGLYLDITGLAAYRQRDDQAWYLVLSEGERWAAQAVFWQAVAAAVASSPAVFCYDLMNEPMVVSEPKTDWNYGWDEDNRYVQRLTLDLAGRDGVSLVTDWITQMRAAITLSDPERLVTLGLIGHVRRGFMAAPEVTDALDFVAIHLYPRPLEMEDAFDLVSLYDRGQPLVIEETLNLHCSGRQLEWFMRQSRGRAEGFLGHYFGKTPDEPVVTIAEAVQREGILIFEKLSDSLRASSPDSLAIHEYWNPTLGDHFFTTERRDPLLAALGYGYGMRQGRLHHWNPGGGVPLCSFYDHDLERHFLSSGCAPLPEYAGDELFFDGVLGFAVPDDPEAVDLHRYQSTGALGAPADNYYSVLRNDPAFSLNGYAYIGVEGKVLPALP